MTKPGSFLFGLLFLLAAVPGCGPSDPREKVLDRRALWNVALLDWAMAEDGAITMSARITGPATRKLDRLTVRIELTDAEGRAVDHEWRTLDLTGIRRGGPEDIVIQLDSRGTDVEGIAINPVLDPDPEEARHIVELQM